MSWRNVKLIYLREIRDQLRDRRTLFMIAVLPLMLYPLIGMTVFQLTQFLRKNEARVVVVGSEQLTEHSDLPALVGDGQFADDLFDDLRRFCTSPDNFRKHGERDENERRELAGK